MIRGHADHRHSCPQHPVTGHSATPAHTATSLRRPPPHQRLCSACLDRLPIVHQRPLAAAPTRELGCGSQSSTGGGCATGGRRELLTATRRPKCATDGRNGGAERRPPRRIPNSTWIVIGYLLVPAGPDRLGGRPAQARPDSSVTTSTIDQALPSLTALCLLVRDSYHIGEAAMTGRRDNAIERYQGLQ